MKTIREDWTLVILWVTLLTCREQACIHKDGLSISDYTTELLLCWDIDCVAPACWKNRHVCLRSKRDWNWPEHYLWTFPPGTGILEFTWAEQE